MKSHWHRGQGDEHHSPVEMRFIDMFMTALGSLVFIALLLVFLLPKTTQQGSTDEQLKTKVDQLITENQQLKQQIQQQGQASQSSSAKTEDVDIMRRWFGVMLVTSGCRPGEPEIYARLEGKIVNVKTGEPQPDAVEFDASNPSNRAGFFGANYFSIREGPPEATSGVTKLFYGASRAGGASWSVYVGLKEPELQGDGQCAVKPIFLTSSQGLIFGDMIKMTQHQPFAWLRHFKVNVDGTTTLATLPRNDEEFKRALAEFSEKQSKILWEKKGLCNTIDAHYALLVPQPPVSTDSNLQIPSNAIRWDYGQSTVYSDGSRRRFYFESPACEVEIAGAKPGTLLLEGKVETDHGRKIYDGTAYSYSKGCKAKEYSVSGEVSDDFQHINVRGRKPILDSSCKVTGVSDEATTLDLRQPKGSDVADSLPVNGPSFRECNACPEMIVVPAGSFTMGSPDSEQGRASDEGPQHTVTIAAPFAVGKYAVTFDEWDACTADGGCNGYRPYDKGWGRGRRPVINVSWDDANAYTTWLSHKTGKTYRLPTEAEREYFTRAGTRTPYWQGSTISPNNANYAEDFADNKIENRRFTVPVDKFAANAWGLYQVHGNVFEWTEDCYHDSYVGAPTDGSAWTTAPCGSRVARGGSWISVPDRLRSGFRDRNSNYSKFDVLGFRVVRTISSQDCGGKIAPMPNICRDVGPQGKEKRRV